MIKLLLVDDEKPIRDGIAQILPRQELNITLTAVCANALEALDSMEENMPDILLTDMKMPGIDGLTLVERAQKLNPAIVCIVLSGYGEFELAQRAMKMGIQYYLLKPCSKEELTEALRTICEEIRVKRAADNNMELTRKRQIATLTEALADLTSVNHEESITKDSVRKLISGPEKVHDLREAFMHLIARGNDQQDMDFIVRLYSENDVYQTVAEGLTRYRQQKERYRPFVMQMLQYIKENYAQENLSLQYLADHVIHMRADYIGREFNRDTGYKVSKYLLKIRMERAKMIIQESGGEMKMYEIAECVGLGHNPQYFSALFKKYYGMKPIEYIQNVMLNKH